MVIIEKDKKRNLEWFLSIVSESELLDTFVNEYIFLLRIWSNCVIIEENIENLSCKTYYGLGDSQCLHYLDCHYCDTRVGVCVNLIINLKDFYYCNISVVNCVLLIIN